jgi:hypothetical protein
MIARFECPMDHICPGRSLHAVTVVYVRHSRRERRLGLVEPIGHPAARAVRRRAARCLPATRWRSWPRFSEIGGGVTLSIICNTPAGVIFRRIRGGEFTWSMPMERISPWMDEKPYRFQLILVDHTAVLCALLIAMARF